MSTSSRSSRLMRALAPVAVTLALCLLSRAAVAAPTATVQGTDDHDTAWRVGNLSDRLSLLKTQAEAGQHDLFRANCRHMDDSLFTIQNRLRDLPEGDQVKVVISESPPAQARAELEAKKQKKQALIDTGKRYNRAIGTIDDRIAAGVDKFHLDWVKALFGQLKHATGVPAWYEVPTEFWDWYEESKQAGQDLTADLNTVRKLSDLRDALRERQRKALDEAHQLDEEIAAEEPPLSELETAFNSVVQKYPFVVVGAAPPVQTQAPELSICFLVDCSGSMNGNKLQDARAAIRSSVERTDDGRTEWALLGFGDCNFWEEHGFTQVAAEINTAAEGLSADGDTPLTYSMYKALTYLANEGRGQTRRLIVLCDGQDNCEERGSTTQEEAMAGLKTIVRDIPASAAGGTQP
ncbi:MAG: vWA domain-containing protein [Armatimonadota bacterium]